MPGAPKARADERGCWPGDAGAQVDPRCGAAREGVHFGRRRRRRRRRRARPRGEAHRVAKEAFLGGAAGAKTPKERIELRLLSYAPTRARLGSTACEVESRALTKLERRDFA